MRVLLVEDHAKLATTVAKGLRRAGMAVDVAFDGEDALGHVAGTDYDVIVLDRDLPRVHGDDVCRTLVAERRQSRVLMLTAAGTVDDRVEGLALGADDYLPETFRLRRARRPHPGAREAIHAGHSAHARPRRPHRRHGTTSRHPSGQGPQAQSERARRTRAPPRRPREGSHHRRAPRRSLGRDGRPVHPDRQDDRQSVAGQARRPTIDRDGSRRRISDLSHDACDRPVHHGPLPAPAVGAQHAVPPHRALWRPVPRSGHRFARHHLRAGRSLHDDRSVRRQQERRARRGQRWAARLVDAQSAAQDRHSLTRTAAGRPPARRASDRPAHPRPPPARHAVRHRARCHGGAGCRSRLARGGAGTTPITDDGGRHPTDHRTEPARKACPLRTE